MKQNIITTIYKRSYKADLLVLLVLFAQLVHAQQDIELNDIVVGSSEVSATNSITLSEGFHAREGCTFRAYISSGGNGGLTNPVISSTIGVSVSMTPTTGQNYVRTKTFPSTSLYGEQVTYFDGLGRPIQSIQVNASPDGDDIIQHVHYDDLGRENKKCLPYVDDGNGEYRSTAEADLESFYQGSIAGKDAPDNNPYSETIFESSPLNRVLSTTGVGENWYTNNKAVSYDYKTNTGAISSWDEKGATITYPASSLYVNEITDENGNVTREYIDLLGKVVLKESVIEAETFRTHYVYDDFGLLCTIVPPLASSPTNVDLCYFYEYDGRKRMISKKLPGAEIVYMVYDSRDRLVLVQDGNLRDDGDPAIETFQFTKYDALNRPVMTGKITITGTLQTIRDQFDVQTTLYETYNRSASTYGYTLNNSYPVTCAITASDVETVTWYDTYDFVTDLSLQSELDYYTTNLPTGFETSESGNVKGLTTGNMVKAYEPQNSEYTVANTEMYSATYYDDYGNVIQTLAQNHLGGLDIVSSSYESITQQLQQTQQQHKKDGVVQLTILESYDYDHTGRLLETRHQVNDQAEIWLSSMRYNELGELTEKYMHSKDGSSFVQKVDYTYNIRGWLTKINDPVLADNDVFGMQLYYNQLGNLDNSTAQEEQYNGNIAAIRWSNIDDNDKIRGYGFTYDALNRLTAANYAEGSTLASNQNLFSMSITSYDKNGNILGLNRRYNSTSSYADNLTYSYFTGSNQLKKVTDPSGDVAGVEDYVARTTSDYVYDDNGNMTFDAGKNATVDYNSLNLPESVTDNSDPNIKIFYHYDASGRKLAKTSESSSSSVDNVTDYVGNIVYVDGEIAYVLTSEGRMIPVDDGDGTRWHYEYSVNDHLGNSRVTFGGSLLAGKVDVIQQSHYYPFGLIFKQENYQTSLTDYTKNKYLYNGKELQDDELAGRSLNWYDYGARFYDPALGRFTTIDPHLENYLSWTPYNYVGNNPMLFTDPTGMDWYQSIEDDSQMWKEGSEDLDGYINIGEENTIDYGNGTTMTYNQSTLTSMTETVLSEDDWATQQNREGVDCWDASAEMVEGSGATPIPGRENGIETGEEVLLSKTKYTVNATDDAQKGVNYLDSQIDEGKSTLVGVNYAYGKGRNGGTTDHFVAISSRTTNFQTGTVSYNFFEPGTQWKAKGVNSSNTFTFNSKGLLIGTTNYSGKKYTVTHVRKNK